MISLELISIFPIFKKEIFMDVGFILLCPDRKPSLVKNTVRSIKYNCRGKDYITIVPNDTTAKEIKEIKEYCPTVFKGKNTITSLTNIGMKRLKHEWGFVIFAGSRVQHSVLRKWDIFVDSEKNILYPLINGKYNFVEGSFNGVLFNKSFFKEVGNFPSEPIESKNLNDFEIAKLLWSIDAINKGAIFKGIVGMNLI